MRSLRYQSLNIVYMQAFSLPADFSPEKFADRALGNSLFDSIYTRDPEQEDIRRYRLGEYPFSFKQEMFESVTDGITDSFKGLMTVEATTYFNRYAVVRYYIPFNSKEAGGALTTELLSGMNDLDQQDSINCLLVTHPERAYISFPELMQEQRATLCNRTTTSAKVSHYLYFDIGPCTDDLDFPIVEMEDRPDLNITAAMHSILTNHNEWQDIRKEYGQKINSENIAATKDELIMLNDTSCVSILTNIWIDAPHRASQNEGGIEWAPKSPLPFLQQKEGSAWSLRWPELSVLIETSFIQRHILSVANKALKSQSHALLDSSTRAVNYKYVERSINENVELRLLLANATSRFEEVGEVNLRNMQESIRPCFGLEAAMERVKTKMQYNDKALAMLSDSNRLHQARQLNIVLAILSAASVLGLLFTQIKSPFVQRVFSVSDYYAELAGIGIISLSICIMTICLVIVFRNQRDA